jgi:hypothetical protein
MASRFLACRMTQFAKSDKAAGEFCPHPTTWLNQGRYDDDQATWGTHGGNGQESGSKPKDYWPTDEEMKNWNPYTGSATEGE